MFVAPGLFALMRDGRIVEVTDSADSGEPRGEYQWVSKQTQGVNIVEVVKDTMPAETIFLGTERWLLPDTEVSLLNLSSRRGGTVVSDMSEVVSILT